MQTSIQESSKSANCPLSVAPIGAALGSNTNFSPPPCPQAQANRAFRFKILHQLRSILATEAVALGMQPYDYHRTAKCQHCRIDLAVQVRKRQRSYLHGVAVCGSVWACPVCCATVQARRREEIRTVVDRVYAEGREAQFVTLTFPHGRGDKLSTLLAQQAAALKMFRQGSPWTRFKNRVGYFGLIRSREITHGANGWHPHTHELWITAPLDDQQRERALADIEDRWVKCLIKAGFSFKRGGKSRAVDVVWRAKTCDYLAKADSLSWGVEAEMTQQLHKAGRNASRSPFEIVADWGQHHRKADARLVVEYIDATKQKSQLRFSKGLKDWAGVDELTDEQVAAAASVEDEHLLFLSPEEWREVAEKREQASLLDAADNGGADAALARLLDILQAGSVPRRFGVQPAYHNPQHILDG